MKRYVILVKGPSVYGWVRAVDFIGEASWWTATKDARWVTTDHTEAMAKLWSLRTLVKHLPENYTLSLKVLSNRSNAERIREAVHIERERIRSGLLDIQFSPETRSISRDQALMVVGDRILA